MTHYRGRRRHAIKSDSCGEAVVLIAILAGGWLHMVGTSVGWWT
jgi:hypothetical protein